MPLLLLVGRPTVKLPSCFVSKLSHVQWAIPQTRNKGWTLFPRCRCRKCRKPGKHRSNMLTNCVIFSAFKHTDPLTVRGRPTRKDGKVNGVYSDTGSSASSKWQKNRTDLAKISLEPNQKSNELSMNTKCGQWFTSDDRRHLRKF